MVKVSLSGVMKKAAGGCEELEIEAKDIRQLLANLEKEYPALSPHIKRGVAVSIDGQIYRDSLFKKLPQNAEIFVIPRLAGG